MLEAEWIADRQLQLSQLSYLDADDSLPQPGNWALSLAVSSDSSAYQTLLMSRAMVTASLIDLAVSKGI